MPKNPIRATYRNGVFKPESPIDLQEGATVTIAIDDADNDNGYIPESLKETYRRYDGTGDGKPEPTPAPSENGEPNGIHAIYGMWADVPIEMIQALYPNYEDDSSITDKSKPR